MITIESKVYLFDELSDEAKEKAIQECNDINIFDDWWDNVYEDAKEIGLKITSFDLDRNRHCKGDFILHSYNVAKAIIGNHGEVCDTHKLATSFLSEWDELEEIFNDGPDNEDEDFEDSREASELSEQFLQDLLEEYSCILQKEYEYLYSDEAIIEGIIANE